MLSKEDKILISSLKGRLSKVLNIKARLLSSEKNVLEGLYYTIDRFIIGDEEFKDTDVFRDALSNSLSLIEGSKKIYIKEYIIPILSKIATRKWGERNG